MNNKLKFMLVYFHLQGLEASLDPGDGQQNWVSWKLRILIFALHTLFCRE
jgi:hypothetical protein